ncbi:MAG: hypothetical protein NVSMB32_08540 [Actinomycetota bacterium]
MSEPYHLVSAERLNRTQLRQFIREQGGHRERKDRYDGYINTRISGVWLKWANKDHTEYLRLLDECAVTEQGIRERDSELARQGIIAEKLGCPPQTYVHLDVLSGWASDRLALRLIKAFNRRWPPCVFCNLLPPGEAESGQNVWAIDELLVFCGSYGRLPR